MAASIVVAVRKGLMVALKPVVRATPGMEKVYVSFQHPTGDKTDREMVWTQNPQIDLAAASLRRGRNFLNETTTFDIVLSTWKPNQSPEDAAERVLAIGEVIAGWIGDHKNNELGITGLQTLTIAGAGTQIETLDNDSVTGRMQIPIRYTARLT